MIDKQEIYDALTNKLEDKISNIQHLIEEMRRSNNDTKSSMGDKYETGRERLQQDINTLQLQLNESINCKSILKEMRFSKSIKPELGALLETDKGFFYISIALGIISLHGYSVFTISQDSPFVKSISNSKIGDQINVNGISHLLKNIW